MPGPLQFCRGLAAAVVAAALAAVSVAPPVAGAAPADPGVRRVLVLSLPGVTWAAVGDARVPHLEGLLRESALGSTSVRTIRRHTFPGDGYATLGAGTAAAGVPGADGLAFGADEPFEDGTAGDAYRRRTGHALNKDGTAAGNIVSLSGRALQSDADRRHRGAEIGILGETLARAGVDRAVIGNADEALADRRVATFHREATLALADRSGALPGGNVSRALLRPDPDGAFGIGLDPDATLGAFRAAWAGPADRRTVVLLEASDLARVNAYRVHTSEPRFRALFRAALEQADALVGRVLADVDPDRDAVVVVAPSDPGDGVHLTVAALRAPGVAPGVLNSASTRRAGFVMQTDLAPTVLAHLGIERPDSMEGRPYEVEGPFAAFPLRRFVEDDREARFRDRMFAPVAATYVVLEILLSLAAALALALTRGPIRPGVRRGLSFVALWLMAVVPVMFLSSVLDIATAGPYLLFVIGSAAAVAGVTAALTRVVAGVGRGDSPRARLWPMAALLGLLLALQIGDVMTGSHLQISTVFGYSPTVGGRFAGFGNLSFGQVATAAILLAGILAHLLGRRCGVRAALAVLAVTLVADGMPIWGSDVGGVLASVPAFSLVALRLTGRKVSLRRLLALGGGAVAAVVAFGLLDLSRPAPERTHLGRLFEQMGQDGLGPLTDAIIRKIGANLAVLPTSIWVPLVPSVLAFLAWLAWGKSARLEMLRTRAPELQPAFVGVLVAAVLGFALNDSGVAVPAMMLGVLNPVLVYLTVHWDAAGRSAEDREVERTDQPRAPPVNRHEPSRSAGQWTSPAPNSESAKPRLP